MTIDYRFQNIFRLHYSERKAGFSNSPGLNNVFVKPRTRDELVWTIRLTVKIKLHFQISCGRDLK